MDQVILIAILENQFKMIGYGIKDNRNSTFIRMEGADLINAHISAILQDTKITLDTIEVYF